MTKGLEIPSEVDCTFLIVSDNNSARAHTIRILKDWFRDVETLEAESSEELPYAGEIPASNLVVILDLISIDNADLAIAHLCREFPNARVAAIFEQDLEAILLKARYGRPHGFIRASASAETFAAVVHLIADGGEIMPWTRLDNTVVQFRGNRGMHACGTIETLPPQYAYRSVNDYSGINPDAASNHLTHREQEALRLLTTGMPNKVIAHRMGISENTIRIHIHHILRKLGVRNRTEAANAGSRAGSGLFAVLLLQYKGIALSSAEQVQSIVSQLV